MDRERSRSSIPSNCSVKIAGLWKRSQCLSRFTKPNYKHRVFILTDQALSYYQGTVDRVGQLKGRVSLDSVRAVEFVEESAFNIAHTLQVVYFSKKHGFVTLYITARDKSECAEWVSTLRQACYFNPDMLMHYHQGALIKNRWTCCNQRGKTSLGCQPTYHLLTRSSSRYAQMRRKDTLTSSSNGRRRSKTTSVTEIRRSVTSGTQNETGAALQRQPGMSNSCVDLTQHPPNEPESFAGIDDISSQRSSRLSTEPSVSVSSITLTRVSVSEAPPSDFTLESHAEQKQPRNERDRRSNSNSRSQVAPEPTMSAPLDHFPTGQIEMEERCVSRGRRPRGRSLGSEDVRDSPPPVPPRKRSAHSNPTGLPFTPSVTPITEASEPRMKHSHTFIVTSSPSPCQKCKLSNSMTALTRPIIVPRVSHDDPNIIHV